MSSNERTITVIHPSYSDDTSDEASAIFRAVGSAISSWGRVEQELFALYQNIMHPDRMPIGASASFFAVHSIGNKLNMLTRLIDVTFSTNEHKALRSDWRTVRNKVNDTSKYRDKLAHGSLVKLRPEQHPTIRLAWVPFYNFATFSWALIDSKSGGIERHFDLLSTDDIHGYYQKFGALCQKLIEFHRAHSDTLRQPQVLPLQDLLALQKTVERSDHHNKADPNSSPGGEPSQE